jgi:molecular chaperone GrpE
VPEDSRSNPRDDNGVEPDAAQTDHAGEPESSTGPVKVPSAGGEAAEASVATPTLDDEALETYQQRARLAEDRLAEVLAAYRQLKSENADYRERMTRNIERRFGERRERLLLKFIEILDNLDRALEAAERSFVNEPLVDGLILVRTQLLQTLQDEGLERVPVLGLPYDPEIAEAMETQAVDDPDHHHLVVKELLRSYRFDARIIRHGHVVVGQYQEPSPEDG